MSLSADALNFVLALDDQLTPGLARASRSYTQFTKNLDRQNQRAVRSISKAFSAMAGLTKNFERMPDQALASFKKAQANIQRAAKPIKMRVDLSVGGKRFDKGLATVVAATVRRAMSSAGARTAGGRAMSGASFAGVHAAPAGPTAPAAPIVRRTVVVPNDRDLLARKHASQVSEFQQALKAGIGASSPAAMSRLRASFLDLPKAERLKRTKDYMAVMQAMRRGQASAAAAATSTGLMARAAKVVKDSFGGMAKSVDSIAGSTKFLATLQAFHRLKPVFASATEFFDGMNDLNKGLHLSRQELAKMDELATDTAAHSGGILSAKDMQEAFHALAKYGTRARAEFEKLGPTIAMATQAMNISADTAAGLARQLGVSFKFSKDEVADVFADLGKIAAKTGVDGEVLASSLMDDTKRMGSFVRELSATDKKAVLENMAELQGTLVKNFGQTGNTIGSMLSDALGDAAGDAAKNVMNLTGMTGGSNGTLAAALKSGNLGGIIGGIQRRAGQGKGNATAMAAIARSMGMEPGDLAAFADNGDQMKADLADLQKGLVSTGSGFAQLAADAGLAKSAIDKAKNSIGTFFTNLLGPNVMQAASEVAGSGGAIAAGGWLAGLFSRQIGRIPVLGPLLSKIPGLGGMFGKAAAGEAASVVLPKAAAGAAAAAGEGLGARLLGGAGAVGRSVAGAGFGAAGLILGSQSSLGATEDDTANQAMPSTVGQRKPSGPTTYERLFADAHPLYNKMFGTAYEDGGLISDTAALHAQADALDLKNQMTMPTATAPYVTGSQIDAAQSAKTSSQAALNQQQSLAEAMEALQRAIMRLPLVGTAAPANNQAIPSRDTPSSTVGRSFSESRH